MSSCQDLCTAEKCAELEREIADLRYKLQELEFKLDGHILDRVTSAHDFDLNITGILQYDFAANSIRLDLYLVDITNELLATPIIKSLPLPFIPEWIFQEHLQTPIPEAHSYQPVLQVDVFDQPDGSNILKVQIDQVSDEDIFNTEPLQLTINKTDLGKDFNYQFTVSLGGKSAIANQVIERTEKFSPEDFIEYLNVQDFYFAIEDLGNNDYSFSITLGDRTREQILNLPSSNGGGTVQIPPTTVSVTGNYDAENNNLNISVTVDGVSATKSINLDEMPFAEILECLALIKTKLEELEPTEVIALVASEKALHRVKDKVLILHFVNLDNYPKRQKNSSYRPIQIPAPKESYIWENDFESLVWEQGNQYAEMKLEGWKTKVSGWFASEAAANSYFDAVLDLTTAIEENRIISNHSNPQTNIPIRTTRPYRAFISQVGSSGVAECLAKYQPPEENNG